MSENKKTIDEREKEILSFWKDNDIFKKSLDRRRGDEPFIFFEGPPTANGRPGLHHVLARAFKDIFPRYHTMRGRFVLRKGGWDTHGLPVEVEVEKELGLSSKKEIEEYGIAKFNAKCKESVWKYKEEWEELTNRMGFWINLDDPYITYEPRYMETLWWIIKKIYERGLLKKDYLITPYCPRCGTSLSSHEVAQGYKIVKDPAVTVRFPLKNDKDNASILVWTTTPWTLLANVAAAVNSSLSYMRVRYNDEVFVVAKGRETDLFGDEWEYVEGNKKELKGEELVGCEYSPPYTAISEAEFPHKIVAADYVSAEDGTGIVHIAPFGEEDMQVIKNEKLPSPIPIAPDGTVVVEASQFGGMFVKEADPEIIKDLDSRKLLLRSDDIEHEYPFCWRCDSPLIYYPRESWMVCMSSLRDELKERNNTITWVPAHTKSGRFGQWLEEVKDWNFSRERYWGTPLPIWQCQECDNQTVVGALREFPIDNRNKFYLMRHGEANHNVDGGLADSAREKIDPPHLTDVGTAEVRVSAKTLKKNNITKIIASPFTRCQETALIISKELKISVSTEDRLRELETGEAKTPVDHSAGYYNRRDYFEKSGTGESRIQAQARMVQFIKEFNKENSGETVLIVTHGDPYWLLQGAFFGWSYEEFLKEKRDNYPKTAEVRELTVRYISTDNEGNIDLHRPFVDEITIPCSCGKSMKRVSEVVDVWFDSGSMPFAQWHYPFESKEAIDGNGAKGTESHKAEKWREEDLPRQFPANFIAEGIDQTRGWFYTLLAISTLLKKEAPYQAVVSHGLVLDEEGQKMSKTKGNVMDPWDLFERFGADAVRWTLVTMNPAGESKRFGEREVKDRQRRVFDTIRNVVRFYRMYKSDEDEKIGEMKHVLDCWIYARLQKTIQSVIDNFDAWDATSAGRSIELFVDDLSNWYVRRSRSRFQRPDNSGDHHVASAILRHSLRVLSLIIAPLAPFIAEEVFQIVKNDSDVESVHLAEFPKSEKAEEEILEYMKWSRDAVAEALKLRADAGMNIRQPLSLFNYPREFPKEVRTIVADEINVKEIGKGDIYLEVGLTEALKQEGCARELARHIQVLRKKAGYQPSDRIILGVADILKDVVGDFIAMIKDIAKVDKVEDVTKGRWDETTHVAFEEHSGSVGVRRIS